MKQKVLLKNYVIENNITMIGFTFVLLFAGVLCFCGTYVSSNVIITGTYAQSDKFLFWFGIVLTAVEFFIIRKLYRMVRFYTLPITIENKIITKKDTGTGKAGKTYYTAYFVYFEDEQMEVSRKNWEAVSIGDELEIEFKIESTKTSSLIRLFVLR